MRARVSSQTYKLPQALASQNQAHSDDGRTSDKVRRLWQPEASLWTGTDEASCWLDIAADQIAGREKLRAAVAEVKKRNLHGHPAVAHGWFQPLRARVEGKLRQDRRLPRTAGARFHDSAQVKAFENKINPAKTLFIVSGESGATLEPLHGSGLPRWP